MIAYFLLFGLACTLFAILSTVFCRNPTIVTNLASYGWVALCLLNAYFTRIKTNLWQSIFQSLNVLRTFDLGINLIFTFENKSNYFLKKEYLWLQEDPKK